MNFIDAIMLGLLQGATEFLPISSSGHLALAEYFFNVDGGGLTFDIALHLGTLAAILLYFRHDFLMMVRALFAGKTAAADMDFHRRLAWYICFGTVPAVVAGLLLGHFSEDYLRGPLTVAGALAVIGVGLLVSEKMGKKNRDFSSLTLRDALLIGLLQAIAIIPGVSRSGITMIGGLFLGMKRMAAARFSFLLSAPVILGAGVYKLPALFKIGADTGQLHIFIVGFLAAAISGYLFVAFLLRFVQTHTLAVFAWYRFLLAALALAVIMLR